jgi:predicted nucleic acid-binding Zn ribbon protein
MAELASDKGAATPSRHDGVTMPCPLCGRPFLPQGRRRWCSDACRVAAHRRRQAAAVRAVSLPPRRPRRPLSVYECDACGGRAVGSQRCEECGTFMRRAGLGGHCVHCDEPLTVAELLGEEMPSS